MKIKIAILLVLLSVSVQVKLNTLCYARNPQFCSQDYGTVYLSQFQIEQQRQRQMAALLEAYNRD